MVRFNQAKSIEEKNNYFSKMANFRPSKAQLLKREQYEFFSKWYYTATWAVLGYYKLNKDNGDYKELARQLSPPIDEYQAKKAVEFLYKLKFIKLDKNRTTLYLLEAKTGISQRSTKCKYALNDSIIKAGLKLNKKVKIIPCKGYAYAEIDINDLESF